MASQSRITWRAVKTIPAALDEDVTDHVEGHVTRYSLISDGSFRSVFSGSNINRNSRKVIGLCRIMVLQLLPKISFRCMFLLELYLNCIFYHWNLACWRRAFID